VYSAYTSDSAGVWELVMVGAFIWVILTWATLKSFFPPKRDQSHNGDH